MNQLEPVAFHGDTIFAVEHNGEAYTPVRPIIENMGLGWASQTQKLNDDAERLNCCLIVTVASDGKEREMLCIPARKVAAFLASINHKKVKNHLRGKVLAYQNECDNALHDYWTKGRALNPRLTKEEAYAMLPDFTNPITAARAWANEVEKKTLLLEQIEAAKPLVEFAQAIEDSTKAIKIGDFAKVLCNTGVNIGQNRLFDWLRQEHFLMLNNTPYQNHIDNGNFVVIERTRPSLNGPVPYIQTRITGKGQLAIQKRLAKTYCKAA